MTKREQLEQAITALEAQRAILGDAVVEAALGSMRLQLTELDHAERRSSLEFEEERKLVTVMFADFSGFTALLEKLDPEAAREIMNACFDHLVPVIEKYEGTIEKFIGDEIMVIFGAPVVHENDPERALRTALRMMDALATFNANHNIDMGMHIGINTGLVIAGGIGSEGRQQYGVMGDTVNLAARLRQVATVGQVLISHTTYSHVRGVFDVEPQQPFYVKGKSEPVLSYLVKQAKPRAFRMDTRGVEGIETRMVGRGAELMTLQDIFRDAMEDVETRIVTVVGEAGVGKSRLLYEFEKWIELLPEEIWYFRGWATADTQVSPYSTIRRMFAHRFEILESDSAAEAMDKLRAGMAVTLDPNQADLVGHLIGFDLPSSQAVRNALESASFREQSLASLVAYLQAIASEPTVIFLEDFHWADDSSLDLIDHLAAALPEARLLMVCLARPALFERRPGWGEGLKAHICLELNALSRRESRALVAEILQRVENIPDTLRDLVVEGAEGNPFYVEELIKMFINDEVIRRGKGAWQVELERLAEVSVPPTLTGVIQARLDHLPVKEREILQRASVVGRLFWDTAVAELTADEEEEFDKEEISLLLDDIRERELVFRREHSTFAETEEYIFQHALLHDVTYETVLLKLRRLYHRQVAVWLETAAGDRLGEYLGLIAGHYELAGDRTKTAEYLLRAGDRARLTYAHQEAVEYYRRALAILKEHKEHERAARTLMKLGLEYHTAFDYEHSRQAYEEGFVLWRQAEENTSAVPMPSAPHPFRMVRAHPVTLDPTMADDSFSGGIINQIFSGLVGGRSAMEAMPDIARSWELAADGRKYIFHLRDDVRWSDGVPVTAADFEFTWKRTLNPANGSPNASLLYDIKGARAYHEGEVSDPGSVGVYAVDEHTLVVKLEGPTSYFLSLLTHYATYPVPRHTLQAHGEAWTAPENIVTNGAFKLDAWKLGESMILARNFAYHNPFNGNLLRVDLAFDVKWATQLEMYEDGKLDFVGFGGSPVERDRARHRYAGAYVSTPWLGATYVAFDVDKPPFNDPRMRRIFALAIDKTTLANAVLGGYEFPASGGFVPPGVPGHSSEIGLPYDPELARRLLAEAGYPGGQGFPHVEAWTWLGLKSRAEFLAAQWMENLGIAINWEIMDFSQFIAGVDRMPAHITQTVWMPDYPDPDSCLRASPIRRRTHWRHKVYDELVEKARRVMDQEERMKLYVLADQILVEKEAIVIPLTYMRSHMLVKPWVIKFPASAYDQWLWKEIVMETH